MKLSKLDGGDVLRYLRLDGTEGDMSPSVLLSAAKSYLRAQTGLSDEEMDRHEDLTIAALVLCAEFYESRSMTAEAGRENRTLAAIIGQYRVNLV